MNLITGGRLLLNPRDRGFSVDILMGAGLREPLISQYLVNRLPKLGNFVDLGSNIGYYTVLLAEKFDRIVALEPLSENYRYLQRNVELNHLADKVQTLNMAVACEDGFTHIAFHENRNWARISDVGERVEAISLESLGRRFGPADMLKMDIEGYERELILNASGWWADHGPNYLFYEHHMNIFSPAANVDILRVLHDAGYVIEIAFDEINPPIAWRWRWIRQLHEEITRRSMYPKDFVLYREQPLTDVMGDKLVLGGRYGSVEFLLRKKTADLG